MGNLIAFVSLLVSIRTMKSAKQITNELEKFKNATVKKYEFSTKKEKLIKSIKKYIISIEKDVFGGSTISLIIATLREIQYLSSEWDDNDIKIIEELVSTLDKWCKDVSKLNIERERKKRYCINSLNQILVIINKGVYSI